MVEGYDPRPFAVAITKTRAIGRENAVRMDDLLAAAEDEGAYYPFELTVTSERAAQVINAVVTGASAEWDDDVGGYVVYVPRERFVDMLVPPVYIQ